MYDILILGALMVHDRTGYKLRHILEGNLEPRRQISNGVMYPLLHKLAKAGYITLTDVQVQGRAQKMAHITDAGKDYFAQLMHTPIVMDAKRESTFRFKFRELGRETVSFQRSLLQAYQEATQADIEIYDKVTSHLEKRIGRPGREKDIGWSLRTLQLEKAVAQTKLTWAAQQLSALAGKPDDAAFTALPTL